MNILMRAENSETAVLTVEFTIQGPARVTISCENKRILEMIADFLKIHSFRSENCYLGSTYTRRTDKTVYDLNLHPDTCINCNQVVNERGDCENCANPNCCGLSEEHCTCDTTNDDGDSYHG